MEQDDIFPMADRIVKGLARLELKDSPVFLTLALVGNDVCDEHLGMSHMTIPEEFYARNLQTLRYVDSTITFIQSDRWTSLMSSFTTISTAMTAYRHLPALGG